MKTDRETEQELAVKRGRDFILNSQSEDGYWIEFNSPNAGASASTQWITGYIAYLLNQSEKKSHIHSPGLDRAATWLSRTEFSWGGWGFKLNFLPDADSTANVLRFLASCPGRREKKRDLARWGDFLLRFYDHRTGGFVTYRSLPAGRIYMSEESGWCQPEVSVSAMAGLALLMVDQRRYQNTLEKVGDFLLDRQSREGYWETYWWDSRMYATGIIGNLLWRLGEDHIVKRAMEWIITQCLPEGGWGNGYEPNPLPFDTAHAIATLCLANNKRQYSEAIKQGIDWLIKNQLPDGSWAASAFVREPEPHIYTPWESPYRANTLVIKDLNRLFTTATVIGAMTKQ